MGAQVAKAVVPAGIEGPCTDFGDSGRLDPSLTAGIKCWWVSKRSIQDTHCEVR